MSPKLRIGRTRRKHRIDDAKILEDLKRSRLYSLAPRPLEGYGSSFKQTERDAPPREIDRKGQPSRPGSSDDDRCFVHCTKQHSGTVYECQGKIRISAAKPSPPQPSRSLTRKVSTPSPCAGSPKSLTSAP